MTEPERQRLRRLLDDARRRRVAAEDAVFGRTSGDCPVGWGSPTGYRKGCRCRWCTDATTAARRDRLHRRLLVA